MGRVVAWALVVLSGSSCSPADDGLAPGRSGDGASEARADGDVAPETSTDAATSDEPGDVAAIPPIDQDAVADDEAVRSDAPTKDVIVPNDAAPARCPVGALLCEDFDKYASAADLAPDWKVMTTAAMLTVDTTKPFGSSGKALHVTAAAGTPTGIIVREGAPLFPIAGNVMYGRMMVWLTQTPAGNYHWNNIQSAGTIAGSTRYAKYGWGGQFGTVLAGYTVRDSPTGPAVIDCSKPSASGIPEKRWVCVEWKFDGAANEMHEWFDGALLADADVIKTGTRCVNAADLGSTWQAPVFANLSIGWQQYQASTGTLELWVDELVIASQRIGCPSP